MRHIPGAPPALAHPATVFRLWFVEMVNDIVLAEPERVWTRLLDELLGGALDREAIQALAARCSGDDHLNDVTTEEQKSEGAIHA